VICADEKPSIQARQRITRRCRRPRARAGQRVEHSYRRGGGAHLPGRARHRPPRRQTAARDRPLRTQRWDRTLRPARLAVRAAAVRSPRAASLDRRQRLLPPAAGSVDRTSSGAGRTSSSSTCRHAMLLKPDRDLLLDRPAQTARTEPLHDPRRARPTSHSAHWNEIAEPSTGTSPATTSRADHASSQHTNPITPARRMTASELTTGSTSRRTASRFVRALAPVRPHGAAAPAGSLSSASSSSKGVPEPGTGTFTEEERGFRGRV